MACQRNKASSSANRPLNMRPSEEDPTLAEENPWLKVTTTSANKISRAKNEVLIGKNSNAAALSKNALKKRLRKGIDAVAQAKDDSILEIDVNSHIPYGKVKENATLQSVKQSHRTPNAKKLQANGSHVVEPDLGTDEDTDDDELVSKEIPAAGGKNRMTAFEQRDLVARAFAGDHVIKVNLLFQLKSIY
jgi:U3 small nucleolar RNA-associated protein 14